MSSPWWGFGPCGGFVMAKKFDFSKMVVGGGVVGGSTVRVSSSVLAQLEKSGNIRQAAIILSGVEGGLAGLLDLEVDGRVFRVVKVGKEFNLHPSHQGECLEAFGLLFNLLAQSVDVRFPVVVSVVPSVGSVDLSQEGLVKGEVV